MRARERDRQVEIERQTETERQANRKTGHRETKTDRRRQKFAEIQIQTDRLTEKQSLKREQ